MQPHAKALLDQVAQVDAAPAHHPMPGQVRTGLDPAFQLGLLRRREPRLRTRAARPIGQAGQPLGVVAVHPVAQGLPVHAAAGGRLRARVALQHQRDRQHPPGRLRIPRPRRLPPQVGGRQLGPRDCQRHAILPIHPPGEANHARSSRGITGESTIQAVGISALVSGSRRNPCWPSDRKAVRSGHAGRAGAGDASQNGQARRRGSCPGPDAPSPEWPAPAAPTRRARRACRSPQRQAAAPRRRSR